MDFNKLIENVKQWSKDKELDAASPVKQMQKLSEEWGELNAGMAKGDEAKIKDSIGDVLVVLTILSQQMDFKKIENLLDPYINEQGRYGQYDIETDLLLLYGAKEIGLLAHDLIDLMQKPYLINTRTSIQFHVRNIVGILHKVAINEDTEVTECLEMAWQEISDRKGKMINGVFVKQDDIKEG